MFLIETNIEETLIECPLINEWIDLVKNKLIQSSIKDEDIKIYYSYGFFVKKVKEEDKEKFYTKLYEKSDKMLFNNRLEFELSKLRIDVNLKLGNKFAMKNRLPDGMVPKLILEMVTEITKVKMMLEESEDIDIYQSIPPLSGLIAIESFTEIADEIELDMDDILDKISTTGLDSLTQEEKNFLDKKSKDV
jgi:hypothetical protein